MRLLFAALVVLLTAFAGCSDDKDDGADANPTPQPPAPIAPQPDHVALEVATTGTYPVNPGFNPATLTVPAGAHVNVTFSNNDQNALVTHNWVVEGIDGASTAEVASGQSATVEFMAPLVAGEHAFFCSIGDHRARGMEGTLSVTIA